MLRVSALRTLSRLSHVILFFALFGGIRCLKAERIGLLQTELNYYPNSHMFTLEKLSNELAARGHDVVVRNHSLGYLAIHICAWPCSDFRMNFRGSCVLLNLSACLLVAKPRLTSITFLDWWIP